MTFALPSSRLRLPLLIGATLLLHYAAIEWVGGGVGLAQVSTEARPPVTIVAQLRAPPVPVPVAGAAPAAPMPRRAVPASRPAAMPAQVEPALGEPVQVEAPAEAPPVAEPALAQEAPPEAPAAALPRQLRASVPPSSELALELERIDARGTQWNGEATMSWQAGGGSYQVRVDAGISMLVTRVKLLEMASEGSIGDSGFAPRLATEKRMGRPLTATHFNRGPGTITFSASQDSAALADGAQDKATLPLQLAAIARADPSQFEDGLEITVGEERGASVYRFIVAGHEEIETRLGKLRTLHLSRPPKPGSYNSRLDVWLAPDRGWYPVRIRNTEASGAVTTQTVTQIVVRDSGTGHEQ